jgi:undecaprenyl-phosphate 4-deoxy-4-formamido-L-arabinose transferase
MTIACAPFHQKGEMEFSAPAADNKATTTPTLRLTIAALMSPDNGNTYRITSAASAHNEEQLALSIVVPVYHSADCLEALIAAISDALVPLGVRYEVVLVNDYSPDQSWTVIEQLCHRHANVVGVDLRRNFGQDNAILTGVRLARGQYIAVMDDDLQHDPKDIPSLVRGLEAGSDVVYAQFWKKRQKFWKNLGSWSAGKVAEWVLNKPRDIYLSPYKVFRREVAELICNYHGAEPYIDGLLLQVTSRITQVPVEHRPRYSGKSTYTLWESVRIWTRIAFSLSVKPLRLVTVLGLAFSVLGVLLGIAVVLYRLLSPESFPESTTGWASLIIAVLFLGGIQMIFFGILGEYAGRTYLRVNDQPQTAIRVIHGRGDVLQSSPASIWSMCISAQSEALKSDSTAADSDVSSEVRKWA